MTAGFNAGHEADPSDGEIAGGVLGNILLRNAEEALHTLVNLRMKANKPPLTVSELRAMAAACMGMMKFEDGNVLEPVHEQYIRVFVREADAHFGNVEEAERKAAKESQSGAA